MRKIAIIGSTGSIGTQAIELAQRYPKEFSIVGIVARGSKTELFQRQVAALQPEFVGIVDPAASGASPEWITGPHAVRDFIAATSASVDVYLNAIDGIAGVQPSIDILATGKILALANKETLVCAGSLVKKIVKPGQIWPVDSEHSAIAQALRSGTREEVSTLVLTASGGPFRGKKTQQLHAVTRAEALAHPTWSMGELISINSATLVNKAVEVMEAHELFHVPYDAIEVTVHPQSIVHSMVTFSDGATIAQASPPSMLIPIAYALTQGSRLNHVAPSLDFTQSYSWTFEPVDSVTFPAIDIAKQAGKSAGLYPTIFTAASETAARLFLDEVIPFTAIVPITAEVLDHVPADYGDGTRLDSIIQAMEWARAKAKDCASQLIGLE